MEKSHDSAQYDTAQNLTPRSIILRGTSEKLEYLSKNETKKQKKFNLLVSGPGRFE